MRSVNYLASLHRHRRQMCIGDTMRNTPRNIDGEVNELDQVIPMANGVDNRPNHAIEEENGEGRIMGRMAHRRNYVNEDIVVERIRQAFRNDAEGVQEGVELLQRQTNSASRLLQERVMEFRRAHRNIAVDQQPEVPDNVRELRSMLFRTPWRRRVGDNGSGEGNSSR